MPVTAAQIGYGTVLKLGNGASPEVFTTISEEVEIDGLGVTFPKVKATNLLSPGKKNEYVAGIGDYDTLSVKCNMTRANIFIVNTWVNALAASNWKYVWPSPLSLIQTFSGVPNGLKIGSITPEGLMMVTFKITVTGDPTFS